MDMPQPKKYLQLVPFLVILLVTVGTCGYVLIEEWSLLDSLFMVIITLSTIGYKEVHPLSPSGRIFTIILIISGISVIAFIIGWFTEYIIEGKLKGTIMKRKMDKKIKKLKNHYIVCGFGRVGDQIAEEFSGEGISFVVIDKNPFSLLKCKKNKWLYIEGDASEEEVLKSVGIKKAQGLVSVVGGDVDNVFIVLTARSLAPNLFIVARANNEQAVPKLKKAGADRVAKPYRIGGYHMATMALRPDVVDFLDAMVDTRHKELQIGEVIIPFSSQIVGEELGKYLSRNRTGVAILAINKKDGSSYVNPTGSTILRGGEKLIIMGTKDGLETVKSIVRG
jgi:voltage-gated potassium channel